MMHLVARLRAFLGEFPRPLWGLLLLYGCLATLYATLVPLFEKPDENWHFAFAMYLAEQGELPVQSLGERAHLAEQEGSQPPLYYALLAGALRGAGLTELGSGYHSLTEKNPYYGGRLGAWLENANQFVHGPCAGDCRRTAQAVYLGRALSVLAGALALLSAAAALHLAFPGERALLLAAVGFLAFLPQFLYIASSVSNDAMLVAMVNLAFALALWWLRCPSSAPRAGALGGVAGLAALAKPSGLSVLATMGLLLLFGGTLTPWQRLRQLLGYGAAFALVSGWWFLRNLLLYGEPTATQIHLQVYGLAAPRLTWPRFVEEWRAVANSYWASFGWGGINPPEQLQQLAWGVALLLALLFVLALLRQWRTWDAPQQSLIALALLQLALVIFLLARWMRLTVAPLGRLLFPAAFPIALIAAVGLLGLLPRRWRPPVAGGSVLGLATLSLYLLLTLIRPVYAPTPLLTALPPNATPLAARFGDTVLLEGYSVPDADFRPGSPVPITLYWRALAPIEEQWSVAVKIFGRDEQLLAESASYPDAGRWPTRAWPQGALIEDRRTLLLPEELSTPTLGRVEVDIFRLADLSWLPVTVGGERVRPFRPFSLVIRATEPAAPAAFLLRPTVEMVKVTNAEVTVTYHWEVGQQPSGSYQTFLHLTPGLAEPPIAQQDFAPLAGAFPSPYWRPGDQLAEQVRLPLPERAPEGDYLLLLGLYDLETQQRVVGEAGSSAWTLARLHWDGQRWQVVTTHEG